MEIAYKVVKIKGTNIIVLYEGTKKECKSFYDDYIMDTQDKCAILQYMMGTINKIVKSNKVVSTSTIFNTKEIVEPKVIQQENIISIPKQKIPEEKYDSEILKAKYQ